MSRRLPPLLALRTFEAVARHLSMARAAEELHVTPSAVSQQVRQLEGYLGQPLFRRGKVLALSDAAQTALPLLTEAFDRLEQAAGPLWAKPDVGPLVVSTPPMFAARWLVPRLDDFQAAHPDISLRLLATRRLVDFALEDVDCAIRLGAGNYPGLQVERLIDQWIIPVAAPAVAAGVEAVADIAAKPLIIDEWHTAQQLFPDWETWFQAQGVVVNAPLRIQHLDDFNLTIEAAISGLGVALAWHSLVQGEIDAGRLVWLLGQRIATPMAYHLVTPDSRSARPQVKAFRQWLTGVVAESQSR